MMTFRSINQLSIINSIVDGKMDACPLTPEDFKEQMEEIAHSGQARYYDCEPRHRDADMLMCNVLRSLGYGDGIDVFENMGKWYA